MPYKPQIEYKNIEVPAALVRTVNAFSKICLEESQQLSLLSFEDLFRLAQHNFGDKVGLIYNERKEVVGLEMAGFIFYRDGDVAFGLKMLVGKNYLHLFSADFYGPITEDQLHQFILYLEKNQRDLLDIYDWQKYKASMRK